MEENREILLSVRNLEQWFKMGRFTTKAVDNISFDIYKGEVFGLVGESGCGKTTTGRSIIRLYDITGGSVYFKGERIAAGIRPYKDAIVKARKDFKEFVKQTKIDIKNGADPEAANQKIAAEQEKLISIVEENTNNIRSARDDHKNCNKKWAIREMEKVKKEFLPKLEDAKAKFESSQDENDKQAYIKVLADYKVALRLAKNDRIMNKMQMIFQDPIASLDPRMTVREIIAEGLIIRGITDKEYIDKEVFRVLDLVGLVSEHASRYPHEFSGGQRQRIGIARAIVLNPEFIIADEPISALDVSIQAQVINLLNELREKMGLTILFIAHDLSVVKYFSDRIAVMYFGHMVELATSDDLFNHPLHPYTRSLLSAIPLPDPRYEKKRKRITYNPLMAHDYSIQGPTFREVEPGHFVSCNDEEYARYVEEIKK